MEATPWILLAAVTVWAVIIAGAWEWLDRRDEHVARPTHVRPTEPMSDYWDTSAELAASGRLGARRSFTRERLSAQPARVAVTASPERLLAARRARSGR